MPIVFSALTPHPPVLIPEIGKDNVAKLKKTQAAMEQLEQEFYAAKPDSIIIISDQGKISPEMFGINLTADYKAGFKDFGDFGLELKFKSDFMTIQQIRAADETGDAAPLQMLSEENLEHGFSVPLYFFTKHLKNIPIVPVVYSGLSYEQHFKFGQFLKERLAESPKRIAVIGSGDLSHTLTKEAPGGFSEAGAKFDKKFTELIKKKDAAGLIKMDPELIKDAQETAVRPSLILLGIIDSLNTKTEVLSYEAPFGVGYLVASFKLL